MYATSKVMGDGVFFSSPPGLFLLFFASSRVEARREEEEVGTWHMVGLSGENAVPAGLMV